MYFGVLNTSQAEFDEPMVKLLFKNKDNHLTEHEDRSIKYIVKPEEIIQETYPTNHYTPKYKLYNVIQDLYLCSIKSCSFKKEKPNTNFTVNIDSIESAAKMIVKQQKEFENRNK